MLYPLYTALALVVDTTVGDRSFLAALHFGSRRELVQTLLNDWKHALPFAAVAAALVVFGADRLNGLGLPRAASLLAIALPVAVLLGTLFGQWVGIVAAIALAITGLIVGSRKVTP